MGEEGRVENGGGGKKGEEGRRERGGSVAYNYYNDAIHFRWKIRLLEITRDYYRDYYRDY